MSTPKKNPGVFRTWLAEAVARTPFRRFQEVPEADYLLAMDELEEKGWKERGRFDLQNLAHLVPFDRKDVDVLVHRGFPHIIVRRSSVSGPRKTYEATFFPRQMLVDYCQMLHVSPAQNVGTRYQVTPADLFNMVPPKVMQQFANTVMDGHYDQMSPHNGVFGGQLTGRNRAQRVRFRRAMADTAIDRAIGMVIPCDRLSTGIGRVYHMYGLLRVLGLAADWIQQQYGVRPDPASVIEAA